MRLRQLLSIWTNRTTLIQLERNTPSSLSKRKQAELTSSLKNPIKFNHHQYVEILSKQSKSREAKILKLARNWTQLNKRPSIRVRQTWKLATPSKSLKLKIRLCLSLQAARPSWTTTPQRLKTVSQQTYRTIIPVISHSLQWTQTKKWWRSSTMEILKSLRRVLRSQSSLSRKGSDPRRNKYWL